MFCRSMGAVAAAHGKKIRLATKSIRVPELIERAMSVGGSTYRGLMCYSVEEALFLAQMSGLADVQDFLIAYPVGT
jgi:D-serine deaminase-like pyridoxal phosphate-dependent protein